MTSAPRLRKRSVATKRSSIGTMSRVGIAANDYQPVPIDLRA
ncbi:hypothetical protein SAMN02982989_1010 [Xaviernesmea oryzae]|uniref:Uncharacterized protein n=1 Tax=Xaviernesmea oryzae TaxID=464029 RepID=A0A1X7FWL3_9HYPH|nr:hypothetical protein SAMN02982989_1010 [Xaviernesmea oryzae]